MKNTLCLSWLASFLMTLQLHLIWVPVHLNVACCHEDKQQIREESFVMRTDIRAFIPPKAKALRVGTVATVR